MTSKEADTRQQHIMVPFCERSFLGSIAEFIDRYRWRDDTVFHLLYVVELGGMPFVAADIAKEVEGELRVLGEKLLAELKSSIVGNVPNVQVVPYIVKGEPKTEILKLADLINADMIVMGSHGRSGLDRLLLGSVASAVVANAKCATVIVRAGGRFEQKVKEVKEDHQRSVRC